MFNSFEKEKGKKNAVLQLILCPSAVTKDWDGCLLTFDEDCEGANDILRGLYQLVGRVLAGGILNVQAPVSLHVLDSAHPAPLDGAMELDLTLQTVSYLTMFGFLIYLQYIYFLFFLFVVTFITL